MPKQTHHEIIEIIICKPSSMEQEASRIIFEVMLGFTEISMFIVGEMLAILLSSKASRVGIRFLNQSIGPWVINI